MSYQELRAPFLKYWIRQTACSRKNKSNNCIRNHFKSFSSRRNREVTTSDLISDFLAATRTLISLYTDVRRFGECRLYEKKIVVVFQLFQLPKVVHLKYQHNHVHWSQRRLCSNGTFHGQGKTSCVLLPLSRTKQVQNECSDYIWTRQ